MINSKFNLFQRVIENKNLERICKSTCDAKAKKQNDATQQREACTCAAIAILDLSILPCDETWLVVFISEIKRAKVGSPATTWAAGMNTFFPPFFFFFSLPSPRTIVNPGLVFESERGYQFENERNYKKRNI